MTTKRVLPPSVGVFETDGSNRRSARQTRVHADRIARRHCHYYDFGGNAAACAGSPDSETAVRDESEVILKLVNPSAEPRDASIQLEGAQAIKPGATAVVLAGKNLTNENSLEAPTNISPRTVLIDVNSSRFNQTVPAYALMVLRLPL